ncbi:MAG: hypothetical protein Q3992_06280 [Bacteroides sp.]|nr:hypothetical protein [Bacteroides sp.]
MASRRDLKKAVNYVAGELFIECMVNCKNLTEEKVKVADSIMGKILALQNEFVSRISHTEPGNVKGFYKKLKDDFNKQVDEILSQIETLK